MVTGLALLGTEGDALRDCRRELVRAISHSFALAGDSRTLVIED